VSADDYTREFLQSDFDRITELEQRVESLENALRLLIDHPGQRIEHQTATGPLVFIHRPLPDDLVNSMREELVRE